MNLLEKCIEALGNNICILNGDEKLVIEDKFYDMIPLTIWGRINWDKFRNIREVKRLTDLNLNMGR